MKQSDMELIDAEGAAGNLVIIIEKNSDLLSKNKAYRKPPVETPPNHVGCPQDIAPLHCHEQYYSSGLLQFFFLKRSQISELSRKTIKKRTRD